MYKGKWLLNLQPGKIVSDADKEVIYTKLFTQILKREEYTSIQIDDRIFVELLR